MRFPSQAKKNTEIPFSNRRYWHYFPEKPKDTEIRFSNEVPITSPEKTRKFRFQIEDIDIIFQRLPSHKPKKQRKSRFQIEAIGIIFQRFPSQAQKKEIPFSNRRYWHYFPEKPKKTRKSRFQMRFPSQAQKKTRKFRFQIEDIGIIFQMFPSQAQKKENPVFKQKTWHYFLEKPKKTRKSRFQMRFPSQAQKKHGNSVFKQKILILFSRGCHHKPKTTTEIPFSNRRYWHYFPEVPITSQKNKRKSRFQIEAIGIIFQRFPSQAQKKGNSRFQIEDVGIISQKSPKRHGNPVFK